ncbi:hypothetical protein RhiirA1_474192 [Rhizophagus irregularis]|uniref:Uncharacterized protein n=2 Tax=Rhizophagus irregularis TaxID=588596 RepID=A0A2I1FCG8_9GLOM|nr:hypothetical protein GLOIN_2v1776656 [Rhizophagus irregularis DAOM 181602=DAOM 197198]PKC56299.1 hypothetical protein RhiirA1_474192 [Rhizophagus irregularis]PKY32082.1 hypothetical protein RhiirB3_450017 [Rhizophagus irregularis]POG69813.1 hypothetical protein GLOIN_2v1776656 [Rhizophagus irregularis DAOM 181602=DAOM 197198]CAB4485199.1 unnamed protein product [Rhizophagus irregularis]|eukprot:XP_025176679.1 hypothetical protein GLOIN_2v1776656 [Rhizophagus irregularis DAOM 181602=DAOM 197198]
MQTIRKAKGSSFYSNTNSGANQQVIQASEIKAQVESFSVNMSNKKRPHVVIPTLVPELEPEKEVPILSVNYITEEEAKNWDSPNAQKPIEHGCKTLFHDLELNDPEAICLLTLKELESEGSSKPKTQSFRKSNKSKNLINKEFERLEEIKGHEKFKKDLEFKEQEEL